MLLCSWVRKGLRTAGLSTRVREPDLLAGDPPPPCAFVRSAATQVKAHGPAEVTVTTPDERDVDGLQVVLRAAVGPAWQRIPLAKDRRVAAVSVPATGLPTGPPDPAPHLALVAAAVLARPVAAPPSMTPPGPRDVAARRRDTSPASARQYLEAGPVAATGGRRDVHPSGVLQNSTD